jgi:hypothetical protein
MRCVALCEVAEGTKGVKSSESNSDTPDSYLVVTNDDAIIVRYLLIYFDRVQTNQKSSKSYLIYIFLFIFCFISFFLMRNLYGRKQLKY